MTPGLSRATTEPEETFSRGPKHFHRAPLEIFFKFFFSKWCILAYFIFLADGGAHKRRAARGSLPTSPSQRACMTLCRRGSGGNNAIFRPKTTTVNPRVLYVAISGGVDDDSDVDNRPCVQHRLNDSVGCYPTQRSLHRILGVAG